jgi:hypothetical protein
VDEFERVRSSERIAVPAEDLDGRDVAVDEVALAVDDDDDVGEVLGEKCSEVGGGVRQMTVLSPLPSR